MTLNDLITELEIMEEAHGPNTEVRLAYQPTYPLEARIKHITELESSNNEDGEPGAACVYIAGESTENYAPGFVYGGYMS